MPAPTKLATGQVTISSNTVPTMIVAERTSRVKLKFAPTNQIWIGSDSGVTSANGYLVGEEIEIESGSAVYAVHDGSPANVNFIETYY